MSNLAPKTTAQWASFDPDLHFIADPDGKHAYVYTDTSGVVRDAAAQDSPDTAGPKFQLSHVCLGEGGSTDGEATAAGGTDTTSGGTDTTAGGTDTTAGGTDTTSGGTDTTAGGTDTTVGGTDTTAGGTDTTAGGTDTTSGGTDTTAGGTDTTAGGTDTTAGGTDTTAGGSDTAGADGDVGSADSAQDGGSTGDPAVAPTKSSNDDGPEVAGKLFRDTLPQTGREDRSLALLGTALIGLGGLSLLARREVTTRS
jgi:LPXTG-motif cell wall-anchored protein